MGVKAQTRVKSWWEFIPEEAGNEAHIEVDDVEFVQPVGFVWLYKPRYRVKAASKKL